MKKYSLAIVESAAQIAVVVLCTTAAQAQATRTWVSGTGDDANPCSRTAPCKTFAGAISKTTSGGEISVLDPGGFGTVTITKPISIVATGVEGGILAAGTNGITINAGPTDAVSIYGLKIEGAGTGSNGIRILQAGSVYVSDTVIRGFLAGNGYGIDIEPATASPTVYLKNVEINGNLIGLYVHGGSGNAGVVIDACTLANNTTNSAKLDTSTSIGRALGSSFATTVVSVSNGAQLISAGNNFFAGNTGPTSTSPLQ